MANTWTNFYPTLWSDIAYFGLTKSSVALQVVNLTWINPGGSAEAIRIPKFAYTEAGIEDVANLVDTPNDVSDATVQLLLDRHKGFFFQIPYIEQDKANVSLGESVLRQHSAALGSVIDADILASVAGFTTTLSGNCVKATIVSGITVMNNAYAPQTDRVIVVNPESYSDLLGDDNFVRADSIAGMDANRTGMVGKVLGLDVFMSNNLPASHDAVIMHRSAIAVAMLRQVQVRVFDQPRHFNTGYSARAAWGRKMIDDTIGVIIERP